MSGANLPIGTGRNAATAELGQLWECPSTREEDPSTCFWLESVSWEVNIDMMLE